MASHKTTNQGYPSRGNRRKRSRVVPIWAFLLLGGVFLVGAALLWPRVDSKVNSPTVPVEARGKPSLKVDQEKLDFGDVKLDKAITATFKISNAGDKPLQFTRKPYIEVAAGC